MPDTDLEGLLTSFVADNGFVLFGVSGKGCRVWTEGGGNPKSSWEVGEASIIPWVEDDLSRVLLVNGAISGAPWGESESPTSPESADESPKGPGCRQGHGACWDDKEVSVDP